MIQIKSFVFNPFMENTYVVYDETKEAIIIDPGCYDEREKQEISDFISNEGLKVVKLLNTHCHIDHVLGNSFIKEHYKVDLFLHQIDEQTLRSVEVYAPAYGFQNYTPTTADKYLDEQDTVEFGHSKLAVMFVPGHAPGHIVFWHKESNQLIGGDVLFRDSIGRTDLPGGNHEQLITNIQEKLFVLPDETIVYPGHGDTTTIGYEKVNNPFCALTSN